MLTQLNLCQLSKYGESQNKSSQLEWITTNDFNLTVWNAVKPSKTIRESLLKSGFDVLIRAESWWLTSNPVKLGTVKSKNRGCYVPPPPARTKIDRPRPFNTPVAGLAWGVGRTCHPEKKERKKRRGSIFCVLLWSCIFILVSFPFAIFIPFHCAPPLPPPPVRGDPVKSGSYPRAIDGLVHGFIADSIKVDLFLSKKGHQVESETPERNRWKLSEMLCWLRSQGMRVTNERSYSVQGDEKNTSTKYAKNSSIPKNCEVWRKIGGKTKRESW